MTRPLPQGKAGTIADASAASLVDRYAPPAWLPYLRLARVDRPIGFWLLALPCFWSIGIAYRSVGVPYPDLWTMLLFALGAIVMRGAGCTYNDILDRDIDKGVARTRTRPLPSGQVTTGGAVTFMVALCLIGFVVLLNFNMLTIALGIAVLPIVALYPLVKRFSDWPQAVLGLAFSWGALMGYAAVHGRIDWPAILLYAGAVAWTIGYDTIYAHQDREDDGILGVKSTALKFGGATKLWLAALYGIAWVCITAAGLGADAGTVFLVGMAVAAAQLAWQVITLDIDDPENCLARFRSNRDFGLLVLAAILLDMFLGALL